MPSRHERSLLIGSPRDKNRSRSPDNQSKLIQNVGPRQTESSMDHQSGSSNQGNVQAGFIEEEPLNRK